MKDRWQMVVLREEVWGRSLVDITRMLRRGLPDKTEVWIPAGGPDGYHNQDSDFAPYALVPFPLGAAVERLWCVEQVLEGAVAKKDILKAQKRLPPLTKGDMVHVIEGPLRDLVGAVDRVTQAQVRIRVRLESGDRVVDVKRVWVKAGIP